MTELETVYWLRVSLNKNTFFDMAKLLTISSQIWQRILAELKSWDRFLTF